MAGDAISRQLMRAGGDTKWLEEKEMRYERARGEGKVDADQNQFATEQCG